LLRIKYLVMNGIKFKLPLKKEIMMVLLKLSPLSIILFIS